jgi:hypothetical protein
MGYIGFEMNARGKKKRVVKYIPMKSVKERESRRNIMICSGRNRRETG